MMTEDGRKNRVGIRVRSLRIEKGLSQAKLLIALQLMGMEGERGVIKRIENGDRAVSDLELRILARFFNVSYRYLLDGGLKEPYSENHL